jgi:hypothetical protein
MNGEGFARKFKEMDRQKRILIERVTHIRGRIEEISRLQAELIERHDREEQAKGRLVVIRG